MFFCPSSADKLIWFPFLKKAITDAKARTFKKQSTPISENQSEQSKELQHDVSRETEDENDADVFTAIFREQMKPLPRVPKENMITKRSFDDRSEDSLSETAPLPKEEKYSQLAMQLTTAVSSNNLELTRLLLSTEDVPSFINLPGVKSRTALYIAGCHGHSQVLVELLNTRGIDLNLQMGTGGSALHGAAYYEKAEAVALLLAQGASCVTTNTRGFTAKQEARGPAVNVFTTFANQGTQGLIQEFPLLLKLTYLTNKTKRAEGAPSGQNSPSVNRTGSPTQGTNSNPGVASPRTPSGNTEDYIRIISLLKAKVETQENQLRQIQAENSLLKGDIENLLVTITLLTQDRVTQAIENAEPENS